MRFLPRSITAGVVAITLMLSHPATAIENGSEKLASYLAAHPLATTSAAPAAISNNTLASELVDLVLSRCPAGCNESGLNSGNWTLYPRLGRLSMCNETMLLDFNPSNSLRKDETVRACTASFAMGASNVTSNNTTQGPSCLPKCSVTKVQESLQLAFNVTNTPAELKDFEAASEQLAASLSRRESNSTDITTFAYSNTVALGLFAGSGVRDIPPSVLRQFITKIKTTGFSDSVVAQICAKDGRSSRYSLGIAVSGDRDLKFVQDAVATWASGECITSFDKVEDWQDITLSVPSISNNSTASFGNSTRANSTAGTASSVSCPVIANKHGQCGINKDFCTISQSETGAPGTSAEGENGCISNCGTEIVVGSAPAEPISIGYFEAYNLDRPCLNMKITAMDVTPYTHIHLAFGVVTTGTYAIDVSHIQEQWELFQQMSGFKKILSLGGWAFSAEPATYFIFRDAVNPANQDTFVANIVAFVQDNDLDGIDIDWEYPAAPDIPDIPAGTAEDAANYLTFFTKLRAAMPSDKSVSFCAPASFWYLKGYHIEEMAELADYIVYMTYDLHGQWDYSNQYAIDGCPEGNCLRSHTNITETLLALSMITKAGVPSNKLAVGVSSYGRSFQMTTPGCTGPMCTYTGDGSGAYPGPCTGTAGYIANAEINSILAGTGTWMTSSGALQSIESYSSYFDEDSQSNIAVYDSTQWVAHMDDDLKADRKALYESLNFAGIIDWAIDLQGFGGDSIDYGSSSNIVYPPPSIWDSHDPLTSCVTSTACNGQDTATTTTPGSPECSMDPDIAAALSAEQAADQTMIDGKQIPLEFAPTNPSDYDGSTFTAKQFGLTETITVIATSTKTTTPTTTVTVVVEPTAKADCAYCLLPFPQRITAFGWYTFEVYNIDGWSTDGGSRLKSEEKGCGALTGWDWRERTSSKYAGAYFNLPFFMKDGCVERAIVSAGGPKLSCEFTGYDIGVAFLPAKKRSTPEEMADDLPELRRRHHFHDHH
ncbi:Killer toxin subunits alpha/beta [Colletotrichum sp. SAR 10_75]|nr:Killer toxin subunits alpha/beta [Colletotrichum sp. SAR 10_75]